MVSIGYLIVFAMDLADRIGIVYPRDKVITVVGIICLMEATRRSGNLALAIMVTVIYIFILLASFLRETGAGTYIIDLAFAVTGRLKGGPALSAVVASSMFGTVSGSPVANVVGTGTFTIPLQ